MRRPIALATVLLLGAFVASASAQEVAEDSLPGLEAEYTMQVGDYAATLLPDFLRIRADLRYAVVVTYEPEPNRLDVEVFGGQVTVEQARQVVGAYWDFIQALFFPYAERRLGVKLDQNDISIVYYDISQGVMRPVVQMLEGQFVIQ